MHYTEKFVNPLRTVLDNLFKTCYIYSLFLRDNPLSTNSFLRDNYNIQLVGKSKKKKYIYIQLVGKYYLIKFIIKLSLRHTIRALTSKIVKNILFYHLKSQFIYYGISFYNTFNISDFIFRIQPIKITSTKKKKKKVPQLVSAATTRKTSPSLCKPNDK